MGSGTEVQTDIPDAPWKAEDVIRTDDYLLIPSDYRLTNTVPFTYRDGYTYLQILEELRKWVNGGLKDNLSNNLQNLAADYNTRIARLIGDVHAELEQYHVLPRQLRDQLVEMVSKYDDEFRLFQESLTAWVKRRLETDGVVVFNPLSGETCDLNDFIKDLCNQAFVNGLQADDYARYGFTVGEIGEWPYTIGELQTNGKYILALLDGQRVYSPWSGQRTTVQRVVSDLYEASRTGEGLLETTADNMKNMQIHDIQNRKIR